MDAEFLCTGSACEGTVTTLGTSSSVFVSLLFPPLKPRSKTFTSFSCRKIHFDTLAVVTYEEAGISHRDAEITLKNEPIKKKVLA